DNDRGVLERRAAGRFREEPGEPAGRVPASSLRVLERDERGELECVDERHVPHKPGVELGGDEVLGRDGSPKGCPWVPLCRHWLRVGRDTPSLYRLGRKGQ